MHTAYDERSEAVPLNGDVKSFRLIWQGCMIRLARSKSLKRAAQEMSATSHLATRFVAGPTVEDGIRVTRELDLAGMRSSLFYLGEYVNSPGLVAENVAAKLAIAAALGRSEWDVHVSVDPTQVGFSIDPDTARRHLRHIAQAVQAAAGSRAGIHRLMLDMEDADVTSPTIALHDELRAAGLPVALTLQAYLKRTALDLNATITRGGSMVRLVRGAFAAGADIAYVKLEDIRANYLKLADRMLSIESMDNGFYPVFATHDERLQEQTIDVAERRGWRPKQYEFEMLYGARPDLAKQLSDRGYRVRMYVPFGADWFPYAVRRVGENPRTAYLLASAALLGP